MKFLILLTTVLLTVQSGYSQCLQYPVSLAELVSEATIIVEATVHSVDSPFWNSGKSMIYTPWRLSISGVFGEEKSNVAPALTVCVEGGIVGDEAMSAFPSLQLQEGDRGVFLLKKKVVALSSGSRVDAHEVVGLHQGFFQYQRDFSVRSLFNSYTSFSALRNAIEKTAKAKFIQLGDGAGVSADKKSGERLLAASISSISPTTLNAGTADVLTIAGADFGASFSGPANVEFRSADDGGSSWVGINANHVVSWTNTQLQIRVPTGAGTGQVRVTATDGTQATSTQTLTISYNLLNIGSGNYRTYIPNVDASGGFTFTPNTTFFNNASALNSFKRALRSWRCNTFVNIKLSTSTTSINTNNNSDGIHVVSFNDNLPSGTLGICYNSWSGCLTSNWRSTSIDLLFRTLVGTGWNFGPGATAGGRYDFESVALHELGHAHQLGHVINSNNIMHFSMAQNTDKRTLSAGSDIAGGSAVVAFSVATKPCGPSPMTALNAGNCEVDLPPVPDFSASPLNGCAPLTVNFIDASSGNPTSWAWDIDNNGTDDYTSQNAVHTFTSAGVYSVKLTASNANGSDALIRTNYITVHQRPTAVSGGRKTVCNGTVVSLGGSPAAANGSPPYTYLWAPTTGLSSATSANPTLVVNFPDTRVYALTVTDANGCASTSRDTVSRFAPTTANAGQDRTLCRLTATSLGGSPTASGGDAPHTYAWTPATDLDNSTSPNPVCTVRQSRTYILAATDANGCVYRDTVVVSMYPQPTVSAGSDKSICAGDSIAILSSTSSGSAPYSYVWSPAVGLSSAVIAEPVAKPAVNTSYTVIVTDANGCVARDTVDIVVKPVPNPVISASGSLDLCQGDSVLLDAGAGYASYLWNNGSTTRTIMVKNQGVYSATVRNSEACAATSSPVEITVKPRPSAEITGALSVCHSAETVYSVPEILGSSTMWNIVNGDIVSGQNNREVRVKWNGSNGKIQVVRQWNGCTSSQEKNITVGTELKPTIALESSRSCIGDTVILSTVPGMAEYRWSNGASTQKALILEEGEYTVFVKDAAGCSGTSDSYRVQFFSNPEVPNIVRGHDTLFCTPGYVLYNWYLNNGLIDNELRPFLVVSQPGLYSAKVFDVNNCSVQSEQFLVEGVSTEDVQTTGMRVFPNPVESALTVANAENMVLTLRNFTGEILLQRRVETDSAVLLFDEFPAGMYILEAVSKMNSSAFLIVRL